MACHGICSLLNDDICMNLCPLDLEPHLYYVQTIGAWCYFNHPNLAHPLAKVSIHDHDKIATFNAFIVSRALN